MFGSFFAVLKEVISKNIILFSCGYFVHKTIWIKPKININMLEFKPFLINTEILNFGKIKSGKKLSQSSYKFR